MEKAMKKISEIKGSLLQQKKSSLPSTLDLGSQKQLRKNKYGSFEISLYVDNPPTREEVVAAVGRLSVAFPRMNKEFFVLMTEFIAKHRFTAKQLSDAVDHLIANFPYKELNIADVLKFDKCEKLYSHAEFYEMITSGKAVHEDYEKKMIEGKIYYYRKGITI